MSRENDDKSLGSHGTNIKWSDIDKVKFFGIGTGLYTAITITLHPINVIKTRQQVLTDSFQNIITNGNAVTSSSSSSSLANIVRHVSKLYRGVGIILILAIPARGVYIGTLENSREFIRNFLSDSFKNENGTKSKTPLLVSISGGIAGGVASMAAQTLAVPMDIISQKQMVMNEKLYAESGSAINVISNAVKNEGWRGLYRGFGLSLFTSLPVGSLWWGTYSGAQHYLMNNMSTIHGIGHTNEASSHHEHRFRSIVVQGTVQIISGLSAAIVAATCTQPLDVIKTRLQVGAQTSQVMMMTTTATTKHFAQMHNHHSYHSVAMDLYTSFGIKGFFRGLGPRVVSMGLWGTALSSAYEYLRHVSRVDQS